MCIAPKTIRIAQWLPLFNPVLLPSPGVIGKFGFVRLGQRKRSFVGVSVKTKMELRVEIDRMGVVQPATEDYAEAAIKAIKSGNVIAVPTDTLYGFACDACTRRKGGITAIVWLEHSMI
nr:yrdC domain-containing protein, mitochondrial-like [Ipomoea batatas]